MTSRAHLLLEASGAPAFTLQQGGWITSVSNYKCSPIAFRARVLRFEPGAVRFPLRERSKLQRLGQKLQDKPQARSFAFYRSGGSPPPPLSTYVT